MTLTKRSRVKDEYIKQIQQGKRKYRLDYVRLQYFFNIEILKWSSYLESLLKFLNPKKIWVEKFMKKMRIKN